MRSWKKHSGKGKPDIFNPDQDAQSTGDAFTGLLEQHRVRVRMGGRSSYDNDPFIEKLRRSVKYEEVYLKAYQDGKAAKAGIGRYLRFYDAELPHEALAPTPAEFHYCSIAYGGGYK
ncbi:MAG: hypothetical protein HYX90_05885 [Chloroflexi bacterium]|nr:hypothetical protein [Chloroflexota bacterium]